MATVLQVSGVLSEIDHRKVYISHLLRLSLQGGPFPLVLLFKKFSDFDVKNIRCSRCTQLLLGPRKISLLPSHTRCLRVTFKI